LGQFLIDDRRQTFIHLRIEQLRFNACQLGVDMGFEFRIQLEAADEFFSPRRT
jgi:hypothetical protein